MPVRRNCADLLYNNVDEEFQNLLRPLNLIQSIYFYPKYRIRDNFITSNSYATKLLAFFVTIGYIIIPFYQMVVRITGHTSIIGIKKVFIVPDYFAFANSVFGFGINFLSCVLLSNSNISLVLRLQEAYRILICSKSKLKTLIIYNWISIIALLATDVIISVSFLYVLNNLSLFNVFPYFIYMSFDFNIIYAICMSRMLSKTIVMWNLRVSGEDELCWKKMSNAYMNILEAYALYGKVFQSYVSTLNLLHLIKYYHGKCSEELLECMPSSHALCCAI